MRAIRNKLFSVDFYTELISLALRRWIFSCHVPTKHSKWIRLSYDFTHHLNFLLMTYGLWMISKWCVTEHRWLKFLMQKERWWQDWRNKWAMKEKRAAAKLQKNIKLQIMNGVCCFWNRLLYKHTLHWATAPSVRQPSVCSQNHLILFIVIVFGFPSYSLYLFCLNWLSTTISISLKCLRWS